jgi:MFS family permease
MSSEMTHGVLPLFLTGTLGASVAVVGLIDGLSEALAQIMKLFSGTASDRVRSRKWLAVAGYGLSALTKPLFPLAATPMAVLAARLCDRIGKGIRGSPRDAMVADMAEPEVRGAAFGLRQALDTVGALLGPLLAFGMLWLLQFEIRTILWLACVPAFLTVIILVFGVKEPARTLSGAPAKSWREILIFANPGRAFWFVAIFGSCIAGARMSEAFLVLKAQATDLPVSFVPLVMVLMSLVYLAAVYPAGYIADRWGTKGLLYSGVLALGGADLMLAQSSGFTALFCGVALWGLHMGLTQGVLGKLVADVAPMDLRGTCFGYFNVTSGLATLASSIVAGLIWDAAGPAWTFYWSGILACCAAFALNATQTKLSYQ